MGKVHSWNYSTENFFPGECGRVKAIIHILIYLEPKKDCNGKISNLPVGSGNAITYV